MGSKNFKDDVPMESIDGARVQHPLKSKGVHGAIYGLGNILEDKVSCCLNQYSIISSFETLVT